MMNLRILLPIFALLIIGCSGSDSGSGSGINNSSRTLTITVNGGGSVVTQDELFDCSDLCEFKLTTNHEIVLNALSADNYRVATWAGCDSYDQTQCVINAANTGNVDIVVNFEKFQSMVNLTVTGNGTVVSNDGSFDCTTSCIMPFQEDTTIVLSAVGEKNHRLLEWSNCPMVVNEGCQLTVGPGSENIQLSAVFERYQNTISVQQIGTGVVVSSGNAIDCGNTCEADFEQSGVIELIATADADYKFMDWSGCDSSNGGSCMVNTGPDAEDITVTARYNPLIVKLYDITFEAPEHQLNHPPNHGFGTKYVSENFAIGTSNEQFSPFITQGNQSQVLTFQGQYNATGSYVTGDSMSLALAHNAVRYRFEWDMQIDQMSEFTAYKVFFDWLFSDNVLEFTINGNVTFNGLYVSTVAFNELFHVVVDLDILQNSASVTINDQTITGIPMDSLTTDIGSIRFYWFGTNTVDSYFIDNLQVSARLNADLTELPPNSNDQYVMDFNIPAISSLSGQSGTGVSPYTQANFNITDVLRIDPSLSSPNYPTNGSIIAGVFQKPIIYHKYGYAFSLHSMGVADYSAVAGMILPVTINGYKRNGEILEYILDPANVSMNFISIAFGSEWKNLDYVIIQDSSISIDNIVLGVTDPMTQFEATILE